MIEYRALLIEYRALLIEYRALLIEYRALLIEYRSLLIPTEQLEEMIHEATRGHEMVIVNGDFILCVD